MALSFVLDEHLRGPIWRAIQQHNATGSHPLDVIRVGDVPSLPRGTLDPDLLLWCEAHGRILISTDLNSLPGFYQSHLSAGRHAPGLVFLTSGWKIPSVLTMLVLYDQLMDPADFVDRVEHIS